jgi:hypothetical protein
MTPYAVGCSFKNWLLTSPKDKLIKIGAKVVSHASCVEAGSLTSCE